MSDFVANCPISMPINVPGGVRPEVDMNGLMFSYEYGPVYVTGIDEASLREPWSA
jgi:hypothetical protein